LAELRRCYIAREPVDFIADMMGQAYASRVIIELIEVLEVAHQPDQYSFRIHLKEYVKTPDRNEITSADAIDEKIRVNAQNLLAISSLPDALNMGSIPELTNPFEPLNQALNPIAEASSGLLDSMVALKKILG
jgi:hypothetical protein